MARNNFVGAYNDLEYADITPVINQRPVKELKDLYKSRADKYNYVVNTANTLETAITNTPHISKDRQLLEDAKNELTSTIESYGETGDFENRVLDINNLVKNVSNKLVPIQNRAKQRQSYIDQITTRDKDGNLTHDLNDIRRAIAESDRLDQPLQYDEGLGTYIGGYSGREVLPKINFSEKVSKILDDWKANKITLTDRQGNPLSRLPGTGKLVAGTKEYTDESELINAAKSYLTNDPDFKARVRDDLYYELNNLLLDDQGERRELGVEDVKGIVSGDLKNVTEQLGYTGDGTLEEILQEKDISSEDLYRQVRLEQMTNSAIKLGVAKESYVEFENKFLTDDLLIKSLEWQNKNRTNGNKPIDSDAHVAIHKITTQNVIDPANYGSILSGKQSSKATLQQNSALLNKLKKSGEGTPEQIQNIQKAVKADQNNLEEYERQLKSIREFIENKSSFNFDTLHQEYKDVLEDERGAYVVENYDRAIDVGESGLREEALAKYPILPLNEYKDAVINSFINKDYYGAGEALLTPIGDRKSTIEYAAEELKDAYGGEIETGDYTQDFYTYLIEGDTKDSQLYLNYNKNRKTAFQTNPNTFIKGDMNFETMLNEQYGLDMDEIDLNKTSIHPLIGSVGKNPGYLIDVFVKAEKGEPNSGGKSNIRIISNYEGDLIGDDNTSREIAVGEAARRFQGKDINALNMTDKGLFRKLSLSYIDNSPIGTNFDNLNLYVQKPGIPVPFKMDGKTTSFLITPQKDVLDSKEDHTSLVYNLSTPDGKIYLNRVNEEGFTESLWDIPTSTDIPIDFNSPSEIKEVLASSLMKQQIQTRQENNTNPYSDYLNQSSLNGELESITPIFGSNIRRGISPYINKDIKNNVSKLKSTYPNLFITGTYNTQSPDSGKALDFRINTNSLKLFKQSKERLKREYGIISIEPYNNSGITRDFSDADRFHVEFSQ